MPSSSSDSAADSLGTDITALTLAPNGGRRSRDPALAYYSYVKDAIRGGPVTSSTTLVELYRFDNPNFKHNRLLRELSQLSTAIRARIGPLRSQDDTSFEQLYIPPPCEKGHCDIYVRLVDGLTAPAIRVEARFTDGPSANAKVIHTAVLDFHFNPCNGKQLSDFTCSLAHQGSSSIRFTAVGATCEGFNATPDLNVTQRTAFDALKALVSASNAQRLRIELFCSELNSTDFDASRDVFDRLPGGPGPRLPSIGKPEFSNLPTEPLRPSEIQNLMVAPNPAALTPLRSGDSMSSIQQAQAEFSVAHFTSTHEHEKSLQLFASCKNHKVAVYEASGFTVIGMHFDAAMKTLGGTDRASSFRLSEGLEILITFDGPWYSDEFCDGHDLEIRAIHDTTRMGLPKHDAFFVVTSHSDEIFKDSRYTAKDKNAPHVRVTSLRPHYDCFLYESLVDAKSKICSDSWRRWHPILLNQLHDRLSVVDFVDDIDVSQQTVAAAEKWLSECKEWNAAQRQALKDMRAAKGGLQLITGPAGTGKTAVQAAQAFFFVKLGGRALCTTTANANADHWAREIRPFAAQSGMGDVRVHRLYPSSKGVKIKNLTREQVFFKRSGHLRGSAATVPELIYKHMSDVEAFDMSIEKGIIDEVEKEQFWCKTSLPSYGARVVDVWHEMRIYFRMVAEGSLNWQDVTTRVRFEDVYEACKAHLVAVTKILMTTNGNARAKEVRRFIDGEEDYSDRKKCFPVAEKTTCFGIFIG